MKLIKTSSMSEVTKKVIDDFNSMNDKQFFNKYLCSKKTYFHRVERYGDPYINSPLAKFGKLLTNQSLKK